MCLIIQGKPKHFSKEIITKAFNQNPHGFGLMYLSNETNRVVHRKFFTKKIRKILKCFKEHSKKADEIALHFRITTNGNTNNKNCHPFQVLNQDNDRADCFLMHNSPRLPSPLLTNEMSDTYYFSKIILRPILKNNFELLNDEKFIDCLETITQAETDSRVLLLDNFTKSFQFLGNWHDHKNLKYSNKSIIPSEPYITHDSNFYFNQDIETRNNFKTYPKIKVNYGKSNKPIYSNDFWENSKVNARDLEDLNGLVQTLDFSELKKLAKENPELVSHYILANHNGYDLSDQKDCELYFEETNSEISFNDLKPYSTY
jgi:hypothetical protein